MPAGRLLRTKTSMPGSDGTMMSSLTSCGVCAKAPVAMVAATAPIIIAVDFISPSSMSSRLAVIHGIWPHVGGRGNTVRHVEEPRHRRDIPDVALGKSSAAQALAIRFLDRPRLGRELCGKIQHGALARRQARGAIVHHHLLAQQRIARERPHGGAVRHQAIVAAVHRRDRDRDHLALELRQTRGRQHQVVVHGDERLELGHVERIGIQHVGHEAELLLALLEIGLHGWAQRRRRQVERDDRGIIGGGPTGPPPWLARARRTGRRRSRIDLPGGTGFGRQRRPRPALRVLFRCRHRAPPSRLFSFAWAAYNLLPLDATMRMGKSPLGTMRAAPMDTAVHALTGTEEERASLRLIEQMSTILAGLRDDIPAGFAEALFARAAAEDLLGYEPRELATLAEDAWAFLADRQPGAPKMRFGSRPGPVGAERIESVSVLEIVNDDMPFLLDSVLGELNERGIEVRLVVHPVFTVERDESGVLFAFRGEGHAAGLATRESFIHIHTARINDEGARAEVVQALEQVLADVRVCVQDWKSMLSRLQEVIAELKNNPPPVPIDEVAEAVQFLEWLAADNFTFLGFRSYAFPKLSRDLAPEFETGLGILRAPDVRVLRRGNDLVSITPEIMEFLNEPKTLIITKANVRSRIHRRVHMDYIGVKHFDIAGNLIGEYRFVGLFTSTVYTRSTRSIPYLRRRVAAALSRAGFDPDGHSGKALANVLETYPRDELFQIDEDTLYHNALMVMQLDERPRIRVLPRRDRFDRFVSVLVYVPRDRFGSGTRTAIGNFLAETYKGRISAFYPFFPEGPLGRVHFIIGRYEGETPNPDRASLEHAVAGIVRTWIDGLQEALALVHDFAKAQTPFARYRQAFSVGSQEAYPPATAIADIRVVENLSAARPLAVDFYRRADRPDTFAGLKVWSYERPIPLSERVPVLENMGFRVVDERTYRIESPSADQPRVWLHDILLERADGQAIDIAALEQRLEACFLVVMRGRAENDGYNALVLQAGVPWRDVALIRTISRFLRQVRIPYSQDYLWTTLRRHADLVPDIVALFHARFEPRVAPSPEKRNQRQAEIRARIETALQQVQSLDEDIILRRFVNAVEAAIRTNFYQLDTSGQPKAAIAIKFESRRIDDMPQPRPLSEIFVYSPRVEGVHLRFGKVARGGLRWSDRPQDFRTEVLGLVKAQQVKNAVIVPVGSKGGFVPKHLPAGGTREAIQSEGIAAYTIFVSSLLDVTDNIGPEGVIPPPNVTRHDADDPYLVVAADKVTATFSDIANGISAQYGFWLGDAFASGGSAGYDHKKMGITARGAWEAVKRHFRELDVDIATTPFTVVGVGDMSGDVFGNGMLLAGTIQLLAAFDHRDIFIDPVPDPAASLVERKRLFDLPRSSWQDYNKDLISPGGGVFPRSAK